MQEATLEPTLALDASVTDEQLAVRAQEEKPLARTAAFEALVTRLERPLYGFLVVRVGNAAEAEELCQEAFLRAWNKLDRYDSRWRFTTWLFTLAKRLAVSRARVRRPDGLPEEALHGLSDDTDPAVDSAEREERNNVWRLAADVCSREQRTALWLRYAEGLSNEEIGRILGKRRVTVRVLLFRARQALAHALDEAGATQRELVAPRRRTRPSGPVAATAPTGGGSR